MLDVIVAPGIVPGERLVRTILIGLWIAMATPWCASAEAPEDLANGGADTTPLSAQRLVTLRPTTAHHLDIIRANTTDLWVCEPHLGQAMIATVTRAQESSLKAAGIGVTLFHPNAQEYLDGLWNRTMGERMVRAADWYGAYHTWDEFNSRLDEIVAARPDLAEPVTIGVSLEGRSIRGIRLSSPDLAGNPRGERPVLFVIGGQHAREWVAPATSLYLIDQMVAEYDNTPRVRSLLDHLEVVVIPIVNPDGYAYTWVSSNTRLWRKNRRGLSSSASIAGVDTNRNWGFLWGQAGASADMANETYRGLAPWSEPESAAIRDFVVATPNIIAAVDVHTYGQYLMSPWGNTTIPTADAPRFNALLNLWRTAIQSIYGTPFTTGPVGSTLYIVSGGSTDWWYGSRGILGITSELRSGSGFTPAASTIRPNAEENYAGFLALGEAVVPAINLRSPVAYPEWIPDDVPNSVRLVVSPASQAADLGTAHLMASVDGSPFTQQPLTRSGSEFVGTTPDMRCGSTLRWYFEVQSTTGTRVQYPPVRWIEQRSAHTVDIIRLDGESSAGWTVDPAGTATAGPWARGVPAGTTSQVGADSDDAGSGGWFTGLAAGADASANDVDGGNTILLSPPFSTLPPSGMVSLETTLSYWRYFSTDGTTDRLFTTLVSPQLTMPIEYLGAPAVPQRVSFSAGFVPHASNRLRFEAMDSSPDSIVEAGVDDVRLVMRVCRRSADMTGDSAVTIDDLLLFLLRFEQGNLAADYSNDEAVTVDDLLIYLGAFEAGY